MLILTSMLLIGLLAAAWGFLVCFLPARWDRLNEVISFADTWTVPSPKRSNLIARLCSRAVGFVIFAAGCWFSYEAGSEMCRVLTRQDSMHPIAPLGASSTALASPVLTTFLVFMITLGVLMAIFPTKAMKIFERVWPVGRSIRPSAAPKISLFLRFFGGVLAFMAVMSLMH